jgi:N utilization substance protein B
MNDAEPALSGNEKRKMKSAARLYAVQALFQMEHSNQGADQVRAEFLEHRFGAIYEGNEMVDGDVELFTDLLDEAVKQQARIDQMTDRALVAKWPIARIDPTLRALFRAAGAELVLDDTPPKVVIAEFVHVASAFFPDGKEASFVNAVLDHMAREIRPEAFSSKP